MDADLILRWLSYRGGGSISSVKKSIAGLLDGPEPRSMTLATSVLSRLETLGHIDLEREESTWRIRPPLVTHLPGSMAFALVVGERTLEIADELDSNSSVHIVEPQPWGAHSLQDPVTLLLEYDTDTELREIAARLGGNFRESAAHSLAAQLLPIHLGARTAGPNKMGLEIEMYATRTNTFIHVESTRREGLYRQKINGRFQHWILESGSWYSTTRSEGICLLLSEDDCTYLRLTIVEEGEDPIGILEVDPRLPLPLQQRRALTYCTGLHAAQSSAGRPTYYNVPLSVASLLANSAHQYLQVD